MKLLVTPAVLPPVALAGRRQDRRRYPVARPAGVLFLAISQSLSHKMEPGTRYYRILGIVEYSEEGRDRRITQLRKGILELAVMGVLYHERHYGYSLVRVLCERGSISLKEGTIYPILARLDRDGLVGSEWVESGQGPPRKYYTLTASGRQLFDELSRDFDALVSLVRHKPAAGEQSDPVGKKLFVRRG